MSEPIICVPARNEAERLPSLMRSLQEQTWLRARKRPLQAVLVLNNCTDNSRAVIERIAPKLPDISLHLVEVRFAPEQAHVGSARRLAMDRAFALAPKNSVLLSTDADAVPRYDWVEANLRAIASGADLVGGHIVGDEHEEALLGPRFVRRAMRHLYYAKLVDRLCVFGSSIARGSVATPFRPYRRQPCCAQRSLCGRGRYAGIAIPGGHNLRRKCLSCRLPFAPSA